LVTDAAQDIHEELEASGVTPGSNRYWKAIDAKIRERFPDEFDDVDPAPKATPISPVTTSVRQRDNGSAKKILTLTKSEAAIADRLGVSHKDYAKYRNMLSAQDKKGAVVI
jgi:hypothetical protein